jgi:hypothetical protein
MLCPASNGRFVPSAEVTRYLSLAIYHRLRGVGQNIRMTSDGLLRLGRLMALLPVSHAALILLVWLLDFYNPRWWLVTAWLWIAWPVVLVLCPTRRLLWPWVGLGIGASLLYPCVLTIFAFTAWTFGGFR